LHAKARGDKLSLKESLQSFMLTTTALALFAYFKQEAKASKMLTFMLLLTILLQCLLILILQSKNNKTKLSNCKA